MSPSKNLNNVKNAYLKLIECSNPETPSNSNTSHVTNSQLKKYYWREYFGPLNFNDFCIFARLYEKIMEINSHAGRG